MLDPSNTLIYNQINFNKTIKPIMFTLNIEYNNAEETGFNPDNLIFSISSKSKNKHLNSDVFCFDTFVFNNISLDDLVEALSNNQSNYDCINELEKSPWKILNYIIKQTAVDKPFADIEQPNVLPSVLLSDKYFLFFQNLLSKLSKETPKIFTSFFANHRGSGKSALIH